MGAPEDAATELGPLSSLAHLERVSAAVEAARALPHIKVVTGGSRADGAGYYFQPTLLAAPGRKTLLSSAKCLVR